MQKSHRGSEAQYTISPFVTSMTQLYPEPTWINFNSAWMSTHIDYKV